MKLKQIFFSMIFGILNIAALGFLIDPIMAIVNREFQVSDLDQIILVITITLILDVWTFQQIQD
ncbi:hypothetical protein [Lentilactobacillus kisonensis]|uniref:Uncharacterized protein n=2 Tax=Lentilactobacillus kisonensis TaxID=481722 RepID=H1LFJ2_9LACO|nr:hypothetical protein [Lentilactobacillus kisonensis]EHO51707.1 hypothetical protein HMPREF9104_01368 [Lentilactobacillus kisonensis F0435]KRL22039.1 hypothetical protein FC98_GL000335 [Lentilactobacillus kisonensis DSM 19906 = JCM 15041]